MEDRYFLFSRSEMETYIDEDLNERVFVSHEGKKYLLAAAVAQICNRNPKGVSGLVKPPDVPDKKEIAFMLEHKYVRNGNFHLYPYDLVLEAREKCIERDARGIKMGRPANEKKKEKIRSTFNNLKYYIDEKLNIPILENDNDHYVLSKDVAKLLDVVPMRVSQLIHPARLMSNNERLFLRKNRDDVPMKAYLYHYEHVVNAVSNSKVQVPDFQVVRKRKGGRPPNKRKRDTIWLGSPRNSPTNSDKDDDNQSNASTTSEMIKNGFELFEEYKLKQYLKVIKLMLETASDDDEIKHIVQELPWAEGWGEDRELTIQDLLYSKIPAFKLAAFFNAIKGEFDPQIEKLAEFFKIKK